MELVKRKKHSITARCEKCGREIDVPYTNTIRPHMPDIDLKDVVQCACGEYHNLIVEPKNNRTKVQQTARYQTEDKPLQCPRCGSSQLHAGNKGFSLGKAAVGGILIGPIGLLGGLIGSKKIMITCLKCGYKWQAGKK